jgi:iron complex outermembrane recepter protein
LSVDRVSLSYHIHDHSRFEADMRTFNPMQQTSPHEMSAMRLEIIVLGGGNIDFSLFAKNIFNEEACVPEQQGVLNSVPNGTFGVAGTSGALQCIPLPPRMAGASLQVSF